jgi:hypothetical protein
MEVQAEHMAPVWHTPEIPIEDGAIKIHIPEDVGNDELRTVIERLQPLTSGFNPGGGGWEIRPDKAAHRQDITMGTECRDNQAFEA